MMKKEEIKLVFNPYWQLWKKTHKYDDKFD